MKRLATATAALLLVIAASAGAAERDDLVAYLRLRIPAHTAPVTAVAFAADSQTLYSAGEDKVVHAWRRPVDAGAPWRHAGTARWEVGYGANGHVRALAIDHASGVIAIGGYGNRGKHGELVWFQPNKLDRYHAWRFPRDRAAGAATLQHEQVVAAAAFSPGGKWFASADLDGQVLLWPGSARQAAGQLQPPTRRLAEADRGRIAAERLPEVRVRPIAWTKENVLVQPKFNGAKASGGYRFGVWRLERVRLDSAGATRRDLLPGTYYGQVTAIASAADTGRVVAAGLTRTVACDFAADGTPQPFNIEGRIGRDRYIHALALSPDGNRLAVGRVAAVNHLGEPTSGQIELWDLTDRTQPRRVWQETTSAVVSACAISPDGQRLAFAAGNDLNLVRLGRLAPAAGRVVMPGGAQVVEAAFLADAKADSPYRVYVRDTRSRRVFDPQAEEMVRTLADNAPAPRRVDQSKPAAGGWSLSGVGQRGGVQLKRQGRDAAAIAIDPVRHGRVTRHCWINNTDGQPAKLALGTELSNAVLVYQLPAVGEKVCRLERYFLGHEGAITSLGVSPDQAYLISGSKDGAAAIWKLPASAADENAKPTPLLSAWGVEIEAAARGGGAVITKLDEQGPLYNRGLQVGDRLTKVIWLDGAARRSSTNYATLRQKLLDAKPAANAPSLALVVATKAGDQIDLQVEPVWNPLLSLYSRGWNWIAWTPTGYYESSVQGDRIIGWQFTRRAGQAPVFATADRFYQEMRRPQLIKNLLRAGSLAEAASDAGVKKIAKVAPAKLPEVRITSPPPGVLETRDKAFELVAEVSVSKGDRITEVALLRDGVVADRRLVSGSRRSVTQRWDLPLTDREPHRFSVSAWGESGKSQSTDEVIARWTGPGKSDARTLWLLAVGISEYPRQVAEQRLAYGVTDAEQIAGVFAQRHAYDEIEARVLTTPAETTAAQIRESLEWLIESPDGNDLALFYFAGHSSEPERNSTGGPTREVSLLAIDGPDPELTPSGLLQRFCQRTGLPKVVIIDSCRSGSFHRAITELARDCDKKSCGTSFFASSQEDEVSRESVLHHAGWLTHFVVQGLRGAAGTFGDWVTDEQLQGFVRPAVRAETLYKQNPVITIPQHPDRQELPLTLRQSPDG
ncbi:MAG: caspase family protein [Planctomycetota bacterium]